MRTPENTTVNNSPGLPQTVPEVAEPYTESNNSSPLGYSSQQVGVVPELTLITDEVAQSMGGGEIGGSHTRELAKTIGQVLVAASVGYAATRGFEHITNSIMDHARQPHVSEAGLSVLGLRRWKASERRAKRADDAQFYQDAAEANLSAIGYQKMPKTTYDPLERFDKAHRTRKLTNVPDPAKPTNLAGRVWNTQAEPQLLEPRTYLQGFATRRNSNRANRINIREGRINALSELYEDYDLQDKKELKKQLAVARLTRPERNAVLNAGKDVRKLIRAGNRDVKRLDRSAKGNDMPGRYLAGREVFDDKVTATRKRVYKGTANIARKSGKTLKNGLKELAVIPQKGTKAVKQTGRSVKVVTHHAKRAYTAARNKLHR